MMQRRGITKWGFRQLARGAAGGLCLSVLLVHTIFGQVAFAQSKDGASAAAHDGDEDMSLDFVKQQLARVRAGTPPAGGSSPAQAIQDENARLLAEESALLNQISGGNQAGTDTALESAPRASVDVDRAIDSLTSPKGEAAPAHEEDSGIEVVRGSIPLVGQPASAKAVQAPKSLPAPIQEASQHAKAISVKVAAERTETKAAVTTAPEEENPVDLLLASQREESTHFRVVQAHRNEERTLAASDDFKDPAAPAAVRKTTDLEVRLASQQASVSSLQRSNGDLRRQLETFQRKLRDATKELVESRNRLMIAETEVERLSISLEQRNRSNLARVAPGMVGVQSVRSYRAPQQLSSQLTSSHQAASRQVAPVASAPQRAVAPAVNAKVKPDMLVATVIADKANLRSGAGKNNSPLMTVSRGTRLAVETRTGDWYRVITPTGTRAWVNSEVLSFGPDSQASPTRTVRMNGVLGSSDHGVLPISDR